MEAEVLPRDDEEQAVEHDVGVGQPLLRRSPPAPTPSRLWSSSPSGRRIWRHTTPVTTSDSTYGAKNSVRSTARPLIREFSSSARPSANGIWSASDSTMMIDVVAQRVAEESVGERPPEVVEPDEVVERLEPVPVVQAVARALHDRVEHEHAVERERRQQERDDHRPRHARRAARRSRGRSVRVGVVERRCGHESAVDCAGRVGRRRSASHPPDRE